MENHHYSASDSYDKQYKSKVHLQIDQWKELFSTVSPVKMCSHDENMGYLKLG